MDCICFVTPERTWFRYGSAVEPGSQMEWNPECPVHPPTNDPCQDCGHTDRSECCVNTERPIIGKERTL